MNKSPMPALPPSMRVFERGWVSSNNILFVGHERSAVVDTGYARHAAQTVALVRHALGGRKLDEIVNTHMHSDHMGGNAALKRAFPDASVRIPAAEAALVRGWDEDTLLLAPMGQECECFGFDQVCADGDTLLLGDLEWRAHASPGHDMGSLMLMCESEGILISADALWENGFGVQFAALPPANAAAAVFAAQAATLDRIEAMQPRLVIPGHGAPFEDLAGALARARARLDYFSADPLRNARNAAKVLLSFLVMLEGRLELATLGERLSRLSLARALNGALYGLPDADYAALLVAQLEKSGAVRQVGGYLLAAENPGSANT